MITSKFIIQYTDALYSTPVEFAPRYDEFRDMFSSGQIYSKEWILKELVNLNPIHHNRSFCIAGAWFGTLGLMLKYRFPNTSITILDIDPHYEKFIRNMIWNNNSMKAVTEDMYKYSYNEDFVINTSCEHIPDIKSWLSLIPKGKTIILQSNNFKEGNGHINCVSDEFEFIKQTGLTTILYKGKLEMPMYTRFMIIGKI